MANGYEKGCPEWDSLFSLFSVCGFRHLRRHRWSDLRLRSIRRLSDRCFRHYSLRCCVCYRSNLRYCGYCRYRCRCYDA